MTLLSLASAGGALLCFAGLASTSTLATTPPRPPDDAPAFEADVLPILERACAECHGEHLRRPKGRLELTRAGLLKGGVGGPAIEPGDADASLVVQAIRWDDEWLAMPPDGPLPAADVDVLERWIANGAEWPDGVHAVWREPGEDAEAAAIELTKPAFSRADLDFFEREVRPLLAANCFECHGPDVAQPKAGLRMNGHSAFVRGGDSGPALVPGDVDGSLLVHAVRYDGERKMPPSGRLDAADVALLEQWVALGAPWPAGEAASTEEAGADHLDIAAGRERWAFRPVERPALPVVRNTKLVDSPVDAFVLAKLEQRGLEPSPLASPRELLRRLSFDLIGLPPTIDEVGAFEAAYAVDPERAFDAALDELLARPEYGERQARHWLDVVRFSQTNGYERDTEKPFAWRYRDWVVEAFNNDLPYDDFLRYQLAGDELPDAGAQGLIATGFYRLGAWDDEPADPVEAEFDELDDVLRTISEGMMGVTIGCARCHDHKFDPFPQEDYYSLLSFVRGIERYDHPEYSFTSPTLRPLDDSPDVRERWQQEQGEVRRALAEERADILVLGRRRVLEERIAELPEDVQRIFDKAPDERTPEDIERMRAHRNLRPNAEDVLNALTPEERLRSRMIATEMEAEGTSSPGSLEWALAVRESDEQKSTHLLLRGRAATPGPEVVARFPHVMVRSDENAMPPPPEVAAAATSGQRSLLADWMTAPDHPLTARVIANRVWHHHFGRGIVATPNDFGSTGIPPTHPELLDWLAAELVANGWSLKALHRTILASRTWRQSSRATNPTAAERDPGNELLWRQNQRRLEAEALRDSMFAVSDSLNPEQGGRGFFPLVSREALAGMSKPGLGWEVSGAEERARRALYAYSMRGLQVPFFQTFDAPPSSLPAGARPTTTIATQALTLLNSEVVGRCAEALAVMVAREAGADTRARVVRAFERVLARRPSAEEAELAAALLEEQTADFGARPQALTLRPRLPERVEARFFATLADDAFYDGPRAHWTQHRGEWGSGYNGTLQWSPTDGPFLLAQHAEIAPAQPFGVTARVTVDRGATAVVLLRAAAEEQSTRALEVVLDGHAGSLALRLAHGGTRTRLAKTESAFVPGVPFDLQARSSGSALAVAVDGSELLMARTEAALWPGVLGLRVHGEGVRLEDLTLDGAAPLPLDPTPPAQQRALASLCLVLLNHPEFAHVD